MPLLDLMRIATPCSVAWSSMTGTDRQRHCGQCDKTVFDLSKLTRAEAEALLADKGGSLCARYYERGDGTIVMADCLVRRKRRRLVTAGVVAAAALTGSAAVAVHEPDPEVAAIGDVELPDDTAATLPVTDTQTVKDTQPEPWRFSIDDGGYTAGAISFDAVEDLQAGRADLERLKARIIEEKTLRQIFEPAHD